MAWTDEVKGRFGFGCMRLPVCEDGSIDTETLSRMVDSFLEAGFNYFDTAHGYMGGRSEPSLHESLTSRHPREAYLLANKLTSVHFEREEDIRPLFESQLEACGVEYFDMYLMHAQNAEFYEKYKRCRAYETALQLRDEGKIRHFGISFHDKAEVLERILCEQPEIEAVQIQFNYADLDDKSVEARKCYEVCLRHGVPSIVMEPLKGGNLVRLPEEAQELVDEAAAKAGRSATDKAQLDAAYALRFCADFPNNALILSGMSTPEDVAANVAIMKDPAPLTEEERAALAQIPGIFAKRGMVDCTACRYCVSVCPQQIVIPDIIACLNAKRVFGDFNSGWYYGVYTARGGKASDCVECEACETQCPQNLPIAQLMAEAAAVYE